MHNLSQTRNQNCISISTLYSSKCNTMLRLCYLGLKLLLLLINCHCQIQKRSTGLLYYITNYKVTISIYNERLFWSVCVGAKPLRHRRQCTRRPTLLAGVANDCASHFSLISAKIWVHHPWFLSGIPRRNLELLAALGIVLCGY